MSGSYPRFWIWLEASISLATDNSPLLSRAFRKARLRSSASFWAVRPLFGRLAAGQKPGGDAALGAGQIVQQTAQRQPVPMFRRREIIGQTSQPVQPQFFADREIERRDRAGLRAGIVGELGHIEGRNQRRQQRHIAGDIARHPAFFQPGNADIIVFTEGVTLAQRFDAGAIQRHRFDHAGILGNMGEEPARGAAELVGDRGVKLDLLLGVRLAVQRVNTRLAAR